jgi:hypothetical protein
MTGASMLPLNGGNRAKAGAWFAAVRVQLMPWTPPVGPPLCIPSYATMSPVVILRAVSDTTISSMPVVRRLDLAITSRVNVPARSRPRLDVAWLEHLRVRHGITFTARRTAPSTPHLGVQNAQS